MADLGTFFHLFRKRGFGETLQVLTQFPGEEAVQSQFFEKLVEQKSYPNTYFRVKKDLLKHNLIAYKLNENNDKVVFLTDKGKELWELIKKIDYFL